MRRKDVRKKKRVVRAILGCQLDYIWNQIKLKLLGTLVGEFLFLILEDFFIL